MLMAMLLLAAGAPRFARAANERVALTCARAVAGPLSSIGRAVVVAAASSTGAASTPTARRTTRGWRSD